MHCIQNLMNKTKTDQKDVEARQESKEANDKPRTKKEIVETNFSSEAIIEMLKALASFGIAVLLLAISSPILRTSTEEGSYEWKWPVYIIIFFGVFFMSFYFGRCMEKVLLRKRFQSGEFESSESIEELEKREKTLETRCQFWTNLQYLLVVLSCLVMSMASLIQDQPKHQPKYSMQIQNETIILIVN